MAKITVDPKCLEQLSALDASVRALNEQKIRVLFEMVGLRHSADDFEKFLGWELILLTVPDRQMAVQLNKLSAYIPNLKFVVAANAPFFTLMPGEKQRRVRKER